jgi:hypothetical protein
LHELELSESGEGLKECGGVEVGTTLGSSRASNGTRVQIGLNG